MYIKPLSQPPPNPGKMPNVDSPGLGKTPFTDSPGDKTSKADRDGLGKTPKTANPRRSRSTKSTPSSSRKGRKSRSPQDAIREEMLDFVNKIKTGLSKKGMVSFVLLSKVFSKIDSYRQEDEFNPLVQYVDN